MDIGSEVFAPEPEERLPEVDTFLDLPDAVSTRGKVYRVLRATGNILTRKRPGVYISDGEDWIRIG